MGLHNLLISLHLDLGNKDQALEVAERLMAGVLMLMAVSYIGSRLYD